MKKRMLIVTTVPNTIKAFLLPFAQYFKNNGWQIEVACSRADELNEYDAFSQVHSIHWTRSGKDFGHFWQGFLQMRRIIRTGGFDLIHVHTPIAAFITRLASAYLRHKSIIVYTAHGFHFHPGGRRWKNLLFAGLEKLAGYWTDCLIVLNQYDFRAARRLQLVPSRRLVLMPGIGIDTDLYAPQSVPEKVVEQTRKELKAVDIPLFLMVAELIPRKRHGDALKAFALLLRSHSAVLAFAGSGPEQASIEALVQELGIAQNVRMLGFRSDVPLLMGAADALVAPSAQEGLPRNVMEALSMQLPVIGTNIRGTRDLLEDGAGLLVEVGDIAGMARAMAFLIDHPEQRDRLGRQGREKMKGPYELKNVLALHEELYARLLSARS